MYFGLRKKQSDYKKCHCRVQMSVCSKCASSATLFSKIMKIHRYITSLLMPFFFETCPIKKGKRFTSVVQYKTLVILDT